MIQFDPEHLTLSVPVARALLEFSLDDGERSHLTVGIDKGELCATDGHTSLRFEKGEVGDGPDPVKWNGRYFPRDYVLECVEAAGRKGPVVLSWSFAYSAGFPRVSQCEPENNEPVLREAILLDARYISRLELVAKACRAERLKGEEEAPELPPVLLTSLAGVLDAMRFQVGGYEWKGRRAHSAWVTIMPMRKESTRLATVQKQNRKTAAARKRAMAGTPDASAPVKSRPRSRKAPKVVGA